MLSLEATRLLEQMLRRVRRGWIQGLNEGADAEVCLVGSVQAAKRDLDISTASGADIEVQEALRQAAGVQSLYEWNDCPERTQEQVVQFLAGVLEKAGARDERAAGLGGAGALVERLAV